MRNYKDLELPPLDTLQNAKDIETYVKTMGEIAHSFWTAPWYKRLWWRIRNE